MRKLWSQETSATRKDSDLQNTHVKKIWTHEKRSRKSIERTKHP